MYSTVLVSAIFSHFRKSMFGLQDNLAHVRGSVTGLKVCFLDSVVLFKKQKPKHTKAKAGDFSNEQH